MSPARESQDEDKGLVGALPTPYTPGDTHSDPVPGHVRAEVMQTGRRAGRGATVLSPLPAGSAVGMRAVGLWRRGMSVLPGGPGRMRGAQDAASSSWTPGSSGLLPPSPNPSFLFRGHQGQRDLRGQNMHAGGHAHTHS